MMLADKIFNLHRAMRDLVVFEVRGKPCITEKEYDRLLHNMDRWNERRLNFVHTHLVRLHEDAWRKIYDVWTRPHINPEMWENYNWMFESDVLEEQQLFTAARKNFKEAWRKFKNEYKEFRSGAKKASPEEGTRGEATGTVEDVS